MSWNLQHPHVSSTVFFHLVVKKNPTLISEEAQKGQMNIDHIPRPKNGFSMAESLK